MGGEFIEIRITHPWEFIQPAPEAVRPRLLDWQVDAKGRHVAWRYRITRYEQDGQPRWWLDGTGQHPWTSDDVEYLKDVAEHHARRLLRRQRWRPKSMYNGQEPPLWIGGRVVLVRTGNCGQLIQRIVASEPLLSDLRSEWPCEFRAPRSDTSYGS